MNMRFANVILIVHFLSINVFPQWGNNPDINLQFTNWGDTPISVVEDSIGGAFKSASLIVPLNEPP